MSPVALALTNASFWVLAQVTAVLIRLVHSSIYQPERDRK